MPYIVKGVNADLHRFLDGHPLLNNLRVDLLSDLGRPDMCVDFLRRAKYVKVRLAEPVIGDQRLYVLPHTTFLETASSHRFFCPRLSHLISSVLGSREEVCVMLNSAPRLTCLSCDVNTWMSTQSLWNISPSYSTVECIFLHVPCNAFIPVAHDRLRRGCRNREGAVNPELDHVRSNIRLVHGGLADRSRFPRLRMVTVFCKIFGEEPAARAHIADIVEDAFGFLAGAGIRVSCAG